MIINKACLGASIPRQLITTGDISIIRNTLYLTNREISGNQGYRFD